MATFFKVVVLGDGGIGKTSICNYLTTGEFFGSYKLSIGADFFSKKLVVDGEDVTLQICDIGGQDQFAEISNIFTKGAHGAILCYDTTRRDTLDSLDRWLLKLDDPSIPKVLVSTKNDVEDLKEVFDEEGLQAAQKYNIPFYIPTSSLKGVGITETFEAISRLMLMQKKGLDLPTTPTMIDTSHPQKPEVFTISTSQPLSAQPLGLGRVPTTNKNHIEAPLAPKAPVVFDVEETQAPEIQIPTVEPEEEIKPSFMDQPAPLSPPIVINNQEKPTEERKEPIAPLAEELTVEPPTEPEKTATQPFSALSPPITPPTDEGEKVTEKEPEVSSDFSFLERLRREREKLEKEKEKQL